jgi:selenide,water dikinase
VGRAAGIEPRARVVQLADGTALAYRLVSFNLGSLTAASETPGVKQHAALLKPFDRVRALRRRMDDLARRRDGERAAVCVVGGGAAGVEIAFALAAVLDRAGRPREVTLVEAGERILAGYSRRFAALARRVLAARGIAVLAGCPVAAVEAGGVLLADGSRRPCDLTVWLTGAAAPPLFRHAGLPTDGAGYLLVDESLRCPGRPEIHGAGDCVTLAAHPDTPKAGVYAVREGPLLHRSLLAALAGGEPPRYRPQRSFLSLLNTCDGRALVRYKGFVGHGRWAWWLKDRIDRRFMARYRAARR